MKKLKDNISGKYFVNENCIGCTLCSEIAPGNFRSNLQDGHDFVFKQPATDAEERLCEEVMDLCPANAICNSGDR